MSRRLPVRASARGFTLTEVSVTLVVLTIIASIALPTYQAHVFRARRTDAIARLMAMQQAEEKWRGTHVAYATTGELAAAEPQFAPRPEDRFAFEITDVTASSYTLTASGIGAQAGDRACSRLRLVVSDGQSVTASDNALAGVNEESVNQRCWNT